MMSGLLVCVEDADGRLQKKAAQDSFVVRPLGADCKSGPQLSQDNKGQPDFVSQFQNLDDR